MEYGIPKDKLEDMKLYRYGRSQQIFRGPKPNLKLPYVAFIGGSEPFGKFVARPFPRLVQKSIKLTCANWGTPGAGPGFFLKDPVILDACSSAEVCVIQVMDAVALSNRMYSVYPRRNLRIRHVSDVLRALYPDIDFNSFKYVPAMVRAIQNADPKLYNIVVEEQRSAWRARMLELLEDIETKKILLWLQPNKKQPDEQIVTNEMVEALSGMVDRIVRIEVPEKTNQTMLFGGGNKEASWMTGATHKLVADTIIKDIKDCLGEYRVTRAL